MLQQPETESGWRFAMELADLLLTEHFWKLFLLIVVVVFRKGIASFVGRLTKANVSVPGWGEGGFEAAPPVPAPAPPPDVPPKSEPPSEAPSVEQERKTEAIVEQANGAGPTFHDAYVAIRAGNLPQADDIFRNYLRTVDDPDERYDQNALFLRLMITEGGSEDAVERLAALHAGAANDEQLVSSTAYLADAYARAQDFEKEEAVWTGSIAKLANEEWKTHFIAGLARMYDRKGLTEQGITVLMQRLKVTRANDQRAQIFATLADLEKNAGRSQVAAIALEKAVESSPGDRDRLFAAAYLQSEQKLRLLSVANYRTLIKLDREHAIARNNLGVCAGEFKVPSKKIALYQSAANRGLTLAMANLAGEKIETGFFNEAEELLKAAREKEDVHENVAHVASQLEHGKRRDREKWDEVTKKATEFQRRVRAFGDALFGEPVPNSTWEGNWYTSLAEEVKVEVSGARLIGVWLESSLGVLLAGAGSTIECSIQGKPRNRAVRVSFQRKDKSEKKGLAGLSLLGSVAEPSIECFSYLSADNQEWHFFSINPDIERSFSLFRKRTNL